MNDVGLLVFGQGGGPTSRQNDYDSRNKRLQVSLIDTPPKLAILDNFVGGTALVSSTSAQQREVLGTPIKHNLPYTPEVFMYIYTKSYGGSITDAKAGGYGGGAYFYSGSSGTIEDKIFFEVDDKEVRIVHTLDDFLFGGGYVSDAPKYLLRIKYYILSNDSHVKSYNFAGTIS